MKGGHSSQVIKSIMSRAWKQTSGFLYSHNKMDRATYLYAFSSYEILLTNHLLNPLPRNHPPEEI